MTGRVSYPWWFWEAGGAGLHEPIDAEGPYSVPWLFHFARYAGWIESVAPDRLERSIPACDGWTVHEVVRHLGAVYRVVASWIRDGRRPTHTPSRPADGDVMSWFEDGWRDLFDVLSASPPETPAATWSPWDNTVGFWRRRMAHETIIHALDVVGDRWSASDELALDGIDEALRLWLGTRVGTQVGGSGKVVLLVAGDRHWTVGLHPSLIEVHQELTKPDASIEGGPADVYTWLWGRTDGVQFTGDLEPISQLRGLLDRAMS